MDRTTRFCTANVIGLLLLSVACEHGNNPDGSPLVIPTATSTGPGQVPTSSGPPAPPQGPGMLITDPGPPVAKMACTDRTPERGKFNPGYDAPADPRVATLVNSMTPAQKIKQMQGVDTGTESNKNWNDIQRSPDDDESNIRGYLYRDGPRGLNLPAKQPGRPDINNYSTAFPVTMARGASWDMELEYRVGEAMGDETVASQNTMLLGPCMNILRHPAWGRSQETYGEDMYHIGRIATAWTAGLQTYVVGCAKHYAANNIEDQRENLNAEMDEQTLREIYGRHFEMVVKDGGVGCVMAAYNSVNGIKSTQNRHLLTDILRNDFGYRGLVLSDWWAMPPGQAFPDVANAQKNALGAVQAGLDIEVPWNMNFAQVQANLDAGALSIELINAAASRILEQKFRFKSALKSDPYGLRTPTSAMAEGSIINNDDHIALAKEMALKSMVLVKNGGPTPVLPIKTDGTVKSIAVVGVDRPYTVRSSTVQPGQGTGRNGTLKFSTDLSLGDRGSSRVNADPAKSVAPAAGITAVGSKYGITVTTGNTAAAAANADFVVVMVGLTPQVEGEEYQSPDGGDRANFQLGAGQDELITAVQALNKPMVVVIQAGANVDMPWKDNANTAVVHAWYAGMQGGAALADLLFAENGANFSGKMPITWPASWNDLPTFNEGINTRMDYYLGYRYYDKEGKVPLYPFGHGLSYTTFEYKNLRVPCSTATSHGVMDITVDITNTGPVAGEEVAMLFVGYPNTKVRRSIKELKAFNKVKINPGETMRVPLQVRINDLRYWDMTANMWKIEPGAIDIKVGPNAATLPLSDTVEVLP